MERLIFGVRFTLLVMWSLFIEERFFLSGMWLVLRFFLTYVA
jgi:hypothetical protein